MTTELVKRLRIPVYIVTAYLVLGSIFDIMVSTWPPLLHDLKWRLAFESFLTASSGTELLGVVIFLAFAWAAADRLALGFGFVYSALAGLTYLAASAGFVLDSLQIKGQVPLEQMSRYNLGMAWTAGRMLFTGIMLVYLAIVAIRAFSRWPSEANRGVAAGAGTIVVRPHASPAPERNVTV
jgi:hypothetical protein